MPSQWLKNLGHKASHVRLFRPLYDVQLGKIDTRLEFQYFPHEIMPGDAGRGRWLASNKMDLNGRRETLDTQNWWIGSDLQETPFFECLHQFNFLPDLRALGGDLGRRSARNITWAWLNHFYNYHHIVWHPYLTAHRLVNWLMVYPYAFEQADDVFLDVFHNAFYRQFQHLVQTLESDVDLDLIDRFHVLWALCLVANSCPEMGQDRFDVWLTLLKGAVDDITFEDGGLSNFSVFDSLNFIEQLFVLKQALAQSHHQMPLWLTKTIEVGIRFVNQLSHSDKCLPCFEDGFEGGKEKLEKLTRLSGLRIRRGDAVFDGAGYSVMRKGKTSVIISHGKGEGICPSGFELSHAASRLIVSCGSHLYNASWHDYLNVIQAYSSAAIDDQQPKDYALNAQIETINGACLWSGIHEGYMDDYQLTHTRRLYLDGDGEDFRGEDIFVRSIAVKPVTAMIRFHIHPSVKISMVNDGGAVLMRHPRGSGWMFEASNAFLRTEESIYLGHDRMTPRKTSQIVLSSQIDGVSNQVKWAIRRI